MPASQVDALLRLAQQVDQERGERALAEPRGDEAVARAVPAAAAAVREQDQCARALWDGEVGLQRDVGQFDSNVGCD
ncbi:MAG: hypothetical protein WD314_04370 [Trueperaceae bacterium]